MELVPVADYDTISDKMRTLAAHRLMEMIEALRPQIEDISREPLLELEPGRVQAYVAVLKHYAAMIKELGLLYRVQDRPHQERQDVMPLEQVTRLLEEQEARTDEAVAAALEQGRRLGELEARTREHLSLQDAAARLRVSLGALQRQ